MARWAVVLLPVLLAGCVERVLTIRSDPPGASAFVDGLPVGVTPCDVPYVWYGTRQVTLEKRGYRAVTMMKELAAPWYQVFPFDLLTDVVLPIPITDRDEVNIMLEAEPEGPLDPEEVMKRAAELREKALQK